MVDTQDLGSCAERRVGSSPTFRTVTSPCLVGESEEDQRSPLELRELRRAERTYSSTDVRPPDRRQLVDHQETGLADT